MSARAIAGWTAGVAALVLVTGAATWGLVNYWRETILIGIVIAIAKERI